MSTVTGSGDKHIEDHFFIKYKRLWNASLVSVISYLFISSTPKDEKYAVHNPTMITKPPFHVGSNVSLEFCL